MMPPGPVPDSWTWAPLGDIADVVGGITKDTKKQSDPALPLMPYLRVANVQRGHLDLASVAEIRVPEATANRLRLQPGDVLLNEGGDRDKLGRGWVWEGQIPNCIHQNHVFRVRIRNHILLPKLLAWFANECAKGWFEKHGKQTTNLASISLSRIKQLPVPIPPPIEQKRLLDMLDDQLSVIDAILESCALAINRLNSLRKGELVGLVPDECKYPITWKHSTVAEAGTVELGRQRHPDWHNGSNMKPYLRVANVFEDRIDVRDVKTMHWPQGTFERFKLHNGDVLLNEGQSPEFLGRPAIYRDQPPEVAFTNSLLRFRAGSDVVPEFALLVFRRHMHAGRFRREARITTNIAHLSASRLKPIEFPIPPIEEQEEIIRIASEHLSSIERIRCAVNSVESRTTALRRSVLTAAFSGRLTDQAIDDRIKELASV